MKTYKPKLKTEKNKTQHSIKPNANNECCTCHKDIGYVFIVL